MITQVVDLPRGRDMAEGGERKEKEMFRGVFMNEAGSVVCTTLGIPDVQIKH